MIRRWLASSSGATAIEYGMIAGLIALVAVAGMAAMGVETGGLYGRVGAAFSTHLP